METAKKVILIVEDEPSMLNIVSEKVAEAGFTALQAKNGAEGLSLALEKKPDLILLDILMPEVDGMTMLSELRKKPEGKNIPVIILTNVSPDNNETLQNIINYQPAYYFVKSNIKLDFLVERINEILFPSK